MSTLRLVLVLSLMFTTSAFAQLTIEITQGVDNPTSIAVVPFEWRVKGRLAEDIPQIVADDLQRLVNTLVVSTADKYAAFLVNVNLGTRIAGDFLDVTS